MNAEVVDRLHAAGAFVLGKTVTTEFAFLVPNKTHNPWNASAHAGRLVQRLGRGGRRRLRAGGHRHADQRLGDPARGLLRRGRLQARQGRAVDRRHPAVQHDAGPARRIRAQRRGCRAAGGAIWRIRAGPSARRSARSSMRRGWSPCARPCGIWPNPISAVASPPTSRCCARRLRSWTRSSCRASFNDAHKVHRDHHAVRSGRGLAPGARRIIAPRSAIS